VYSRKERRFLVIDILQLILVEPDSKKLGWGIVKFVGLLQDTEVTGDKEDSRSLHITVHKPSISAHVRPLPLLLARFVFDDHIRCMAAKQRLTKGRLKARQRKMHMIARLLDLPTSVADTTSAAANSPRQTHQMPRTKSAITPNSSIPGRSQPVISRRTSADPSASSSPTVALDKVTALRRAQAAKAARHKQQQALAAAAAASSTTTSSTEAATLPSSSLPSNSSPAGSDLSLQTQDIEMASLTITEPVTPSDSADAINSSSDCAPAAMTSDKDIDGDTLVARDEAAASEACQSSDGDDNTTATDADGNRVIRG
jgi:hypothetical protein